MACEQDFQSVAWRIADLHGALMAIGLFVGPPSALPTLIAAHPGILVLTLIGSTGP
jgi:hypothetical protein